MPKDCEKVQGPLVCPSLRFTNERSATLAFSRLASALPCGHATHQSSPKLCGGPGARGVAFSEQVQNPLSPLCNWIDTGCHLQLHVPNSHVRRADVGAQVYILHTRFLIQSCSLTCRCHEKRTHHPRLSPTARNGGSPGHLAPEPSLSPIPTVFRTLLTCDSETHLRPWNFRQDLG